MFFVWRCCKFDQTPALCCNSRFRFNLVCKLRCELEYYGINFNRILLTNLGKALVGFMFACLPLASLVLPLLILIEEANATAIL